MRGVSNEWCGRNVEEICGKRPCRRAEGPDESRLVVGRWVDGLGPTLETTRQVSASLRHSTIGYAQSAPLGTSPVKVQWPFEVMMVVERK